MKKSPTLLLINPWIYDFAAFDLYLKPYGLLTIASALKQLGFSILFLDCMDRYDEFFQKNNLIIEKKYGMGKYYNEVIPKPDLLQFVDRKYKRYGLPYAEVESRIIKYLKQGVNGVLITSMMTYWYPGVFDIIKLIKKYNNKIPVLLGGIYASLMYEHALKYSGADFVIEGNNFHKNINTIIKSLNISEDKNVFTNKKNEIPEPFYNVYSKLSSIVIRLTSGCPFSCTYCASNYLYETFIKKDIYKVFDNLQYYMEKFNVNNIAFYDDALLVQFDQILKKFLELFKNKDVNFFTPNGLHLRYITQEVAEYFFQYNFKMIRLSLETSNLQQQKQTGSKTTNQEFKNAINYLHKVGYKEENLEVYILFGFPNQNMAEIKTTIEFVKNSGATPKIVEYSLIPKTKDYYLYFNNTQIDPLLHNNTIFYRKFSSLTVENLQDIRHYLRK